MADTRRQPDTDPTGRSGRGRRTALAAQSEGCSDPANARARRMASQAVSQSEGDIAPSLRDN
jgi:hypothetical protein